MKEDERRDLFQLLNKLENVENIGGSNGNLESESGTMIVDSCITVIGACLLFIAVDIGIMRRYLHEMVSLVHDTRPLGLLSLRRGTPG
jgi:hypothetical protein